MSRAEMLQVPLSQVIEYVRDHLKQIDIRQLGLILQGIAIIYVQHHVTLESKSSSQLPDRGHTQPSC
jgi:hypothetical protein